MKRIDNGATIRNWKPQMQIAWDILESILEPMGYDAVLTCGDNGKHGRASLHYVGFAGDFRHFNMKKSYMDDVKLQFLKAVGLEAGVTPEYDFVIEGTHFHIEYQPK